MYSQTWHNITIAEHSSNVVFSITWAHTVCTVQQMWLIAIAIKVSEVNFPAQGSISWGSILRNSTYGVANSSQLLILWQGRVNWDGQQQPSDLQTCCRVAQLSAHYKGILATPTWPTYTTPPSLHTCLHPTLSRVQSSSKTNTTMGTVGSYSG